MDPVKSNLTNKACADPTGSNCVIWTGGQLCSTSICGISTITDVITALDNKICNTSSTASCYTGSWTSFTADIPTAGSGSGGLLWTIGNFGGFGTDQPQYKWTKEGDLSIRGAFVFTYSGTSTTSQILTIGLTTISPTCFPTAATNAQYSAVIAAHAATSNGNKIITSTVFATLGIIPSNGSLFIVIELTEPLAIGDTVFISLGGTRFNLA